MAAPHVLRLDNLTLTWGTHPAVHHLSGTVAAGECLAVVGPNGAGKTTLLRALAGELHPASGHLEWLGNPRPGLAVLPQDAGVDRSFPMSVIDWLSLGDWSRGGAFGAAPAPQALAQSLAQVGLAGFESRPLDALSGGQFQRLRFARVALGQASVVLLDEPFNAIDAQTTADLTALIGRWCGAGRTVVLVTHDLALVRQHIPRTLLLAREPIAWGDTASVLTAEHLQRAWTMPQDWRADAPWCAPHADATAEHAADHVHPHPHPHSHPHP